MHRIACFGVSFSARRHVRLPFLFWSVLFLVRVSWARVYGTSDSTAWHRYFGWVSFRWGWEKRGVCEIFGRVWGLEVSISLAEHKLASSF